MVIDDGDPKADIHNVELAVEFFWVGFEAIMGAEADVGEAPGDGRELVGGDVESVDAERGVLGCEFVCPDAFVKVGVSTKVQRMLKKSLAQENKF